MSTHLHSAAPSTLLSASLVDPGVGLGLWRTSWDLGLIIPSGRMYEYDEHDM